MQLIKVGFSEADSKIRAKSCVSQRDIQRVFRITEFLNSIKEQQDTKTIENSVIVAIGLVYYFRLDEFFRSKFSTEIDKSFGLSFCKILNKYVDKFISNVKVPVGIAETKALKENLFATLICTMSKIPLIIVGAPGTSKTLSFDLAISNVKGGESPKEYFQNVFKIAIKRQETHDEANLKVFPVVFMDEAGLPEESHESLKVLHYFLDRPKVSFVAISNHILDAAKSNRAINLFRPQQQDDLYTLANGCFMRSNKESTMNRRQHLMSQLCVPYENLMKHSIYSKFYGLRDFIHMISYLRRNRDKLDQKEELILKAIERNFNGQDKDDFAKVAEMFITKEIFMKHSRNIIEVLRESLEDKSIRPESRRDRQGEEELVEVRYKMIIDPSEDDSLTRLLYHYNILNIQDTRMFIGSDFPGDGELQKVILISAIKHAAAEGKTVILSQADEIYENFYDLFNQNYKQVEDNKGRRYYANIAIGSHSKPCRVDPNFQCIVHIQKSFLEDAPQPFLNRFEKFHVSQKDLLEASINALPPCMEIIVSSTISKVRDFIRTVKKETFYGDIFDSFESLLIDMLPKPGFDYEEVKKKKAYEPVVVDSVDPGNIAEEEEDQMGALPPPHEYLDILLSQLKKLAGFNFIYLPVEERDQIAKDILQTAIFIDPMKGDVEVDNLAKTIRANPENIEQFITGAIDHLMKENAPMCDETAQSKGLYLLPVDVLPGQRLVISMIVHFLVRYLCTRLLQLALPEALIVKYDLISETYKRTYLVHQNHFEFKKLITRCVSLQDESNEKDLVRPNKLLCYTRTTSFILSLPNSYPPDQHIQPASAEELRNIHPVIHCEDDTALYKLSAIRTQEQFMTILREYFNNAQKRVLIFVADMQHVTQQRINFVRIMIDEEESVAKTKVGEFTLNKLIVVLLHYPPTIFNRTIHKTRTGSFSRYPAHFLHGWDHYYLDNLQKQKENNPLNIQNWLTLTLLSDEDELKKIKGPMLDSLSNKIPHLTVDILSRIKFGTNLRCVFNSADMDLYNRAELLKQIFETDVGFMLCEIFISYWKSDFIREQIHNYANSIFQNLSNLSLTDLVVTSFWNLFTSFLTLMVYKINEGLNFEVLFDQDDNPNDYVHHRIYEQLAPTRSESLSRRDTTHLFLGILRNLSKPSMEEVKNISHILDAQVNNAIHIPKFPFSMYITRAFDNAIQCSIQEVNKNITAIQISKSSQGSNKPNQEDLNKFLLENLKKNLHRYPLIQFILENVKSTIWMHYLEDFAYNHISVSSAHLFEKQENNTSFLRLVNFWGNDFDRNDIANALLKLHISAFSNPPDFSKLLFIFSSLEKLKDLNLPNIEESIGMQSLVQPIPTSVPIFSYFIDTLHQDIMKIFSKRPSPSNLENIKKWVSVYNNLIIQYAGSLHSETLEHILSNDQKIKFAQMHALYLIARYYPINEDFLLNAFDLAIFVKLELKGGYDLIKIFIKGLNKIEDACKKAKLDHKGFRVKFAEGMLQHHIEQNDKIDNGIISWILISANKQSVWSGAAARQVHSQAKSPVKDVHTIEPGLLTFRFYQYIITKLLLSDMEDSNDTTVNITQFNSDVKQLIADELLASFPVTTEPTDYIPYYYSNRSFIKCTADVHPIMKQPLAHLYYQIALDRLLQLHEDKKLLNIFKLYSQFLDTNLSIDKDTGFKVIARIEKQALFQVILRSYSVHFIPNNSSAILDFIELEPESIQQIHTQIDDYRFGGAALGGHSWTMLYLISNKFSSMISFEHYLEKLKVSREELPWVYNSITRLQKIEEQKIPQFPFMNIKDKKYKSYKECYDIIRSIAIAEPGEEEKWIEEFCRLTTKVAQQPDRNAICLLRMYFWLAIYQEFYLQNIESRKFSMVIQANKFSSLGLSEGKRRIILCFLNTDNVIRTSEVIESLNPDTPIYEMEGNEVRMKQRSGEEKLFLFDFFSTGQKDHDAIVLRNMLCNLIAVFMALPRETSHLSPLFLSPQSLYQTYMVSNLYPKPINQALKYDCGCELNEDGSYGRPDYYSFDRKSFTLHSFYLMTLMNFGALSVNIVTQPDALKSISGLLFSEWNQVGLYCLSQLRTIWLHMQLQWERTQEELGEFLTNCFFEYFMLAVEPISPLKPTLFYSTEEVEKYEFAIHTKVYEKTSKRTDLKSSQQIFSEFSNNVISFRKWYPTKITFIHLQHAIESCRPVDIRVESPVDNFVILHRFISERKRFRISSILLPNLIKFYRLFHTNLNYFITRKEAESKTIHEVITDINKRSHPLVNVDIMELYKRILHFYKMYVIVCRGLIGFGPCAAIRREEKFLPLEKNTKFIRILSVNEESEVGFDALYLVIQDLISTQNEFLETVSANKKLLPWLSCFNLDTSTITPTEENTRNAFVSDLTSNEINHYWTSMKEIDESSLEIFELIRSRTTYTPFQDTGTCSYDLTSLEQDIFWKYIASKPKFNAKTNLIHKVFRFKEIIVSNLPDPLNLQQFLSQMKNYLSDQSHKYLDTLPEPVVQNLEYHFHTLEYADFCRLLNALRQTLQRLAQSSIMMKGREEELIRLSLREFLMKQSSAINTSIAVLTNAGFTEFPDLQINILADEIKVNILYSCMEFFLIKFNSRSYEYCKLPYCVKTSLPKVLARLICEFGQKLEG
ncbi:hypothetical protein LOD99_3343 [Oopsacas minuta]|uniref:Uncharacterized protein n=1 Tax=Oopsacas minuta TaxID=111878 RepID=A0AAV7JY57_9METZ|nr:hypothetical protein LOD99_3343 [Oopsacas minuta]